MIQPAISKRAFTLIEVMLALSIIALLAGALFGTVRATLSATAALNDTQRSRQQIYGLFELCRQTFTALPVTSTIQWVATSDQGQNLSEVDLRLAPYAFSWGENATFYGETSLCCHVARDGTLTLGIEQREIDPVTGLTKPNPAWLPLLYNLKSAVWNFYDTRTSQWQNYWTDTTTHPTVMNLTLTFSGQDQVWSQSFWMPPLAGTPAAASGGSTSAAATPGTATSITATPNGTSSTTVKIGPSGNPTPPPQLPH